MAIFISVLAWLVLLRSCRVHRSTEGLSWYCARCPEPFQASRETEFVEHYSHPWDPETYSSMAAVDMVNMIGGQRACRGPRRRLELTRLLLNERSANRHSDSPEVYEKVESRCKNNPDLTSTLVFLETDEGASYSLATLGMYFLDDGAFDRTLFDLARNLTVDELDIPRWLLQRFDYATMYKLWRDLAPRLKDYVSACTDPILSLAFQFIKCCAEFFWEVKRYISGLASSTEVQKALFCVGGVILGAATGGGLGWAVCGPVGAGVGAVAGGVAGFVIGKKAYKMVRERYFERPRRQALREAYAHFGVEPGVSAADLHRRFVQFLRRSITEDQMMMTLTARVFIEGYRSA